VLKKLIYTHSRKSMVASKTMNYATLVVVRLLYGYCRSHLPYLHALSPQTLFFDVL
jgi:hypothetical protein